MHLNFVQITLVKQVKCFSNPFGRAKLKLAISTQFVQKKINTELVTAASMASQEAEGSWRFMMKTRQELL